MKHFHSICVILFVVATSLCTTKTVAMDTEVIQQQPKNCVLISQSYKDGSSVIIDKKNGYLYVSVNYIPIIISKRVLKIISTTEDLEKFSKSFFLSLLIGNINTLQPVNETDKIKLSNITDKIAEKTDKSLSETKQNEILEILEQDQIIKYLRKTY